jgi:hypothetical protein
VGGRSGHSFKQGVAHQIREFRPFFVRPVFDVHEVTGMFPYFKIKYFTHPPEQAFEGNFTVVDTRYKVEGVYQFYPFGNAARPFQ